MSALLEARNRQETATTHGYAHYNKYKGGRIILKIRGQKNLIYLNADDLKAHRQKNTGCGAAGNSAGGNVAIPASHLKYRTGKRKSQASFVF